MNKDICPITWNQLLCPQKRLEIARLSDIPFDQRSLSHREGWFPPCFERQNQQQQKKLFLARQFKTTFKQKCLILRPLLSSTFPQGFRISKNFGHPNSGSGGKIGLKIYYAKRDRHTDTHRDTHTDIAITRSNRPSGPIR